MHKKRTAKIAFERPSPEAEMKCASMLAMLKRSPRRMPGDENTRVVDNAKKKFKPNISESTNTFTNLSVNTTPAKRSDRKALSPKNDRKALSPKNKRKPLSPKNCCSACPSSCSSSPCSTAYPAISSATRRSPPRPPPSPRNSQPRTPSSNPPLPPPSSPPRLPSSPSRAEFCTQLGEILCKTCNRVLDRPSGCCGTYSVALCIRVEDIPEEYRPSVTCSGSIRAHFPSFAKAKRYRIFLSHQISKNRKLRFLVNFDAKKIVDTARKRPRFDHGMTASLNPKPEPGETGYVSPMLMAARIQSASMALLHDPYSHPLSTVGLSQQLTSQTAIPDYNMYSRMF